MDVLIACHCNKPIINEKEVGINRVSSPELIFNVGQKNKNHDAKTTVNIYYSDNDPECPQQENQYGKMEDIKDRKFDLVWFQYCPMFAKEEIFLKFIETGMSLLKENGTLITYAHQNYFESHKSILQNKYQKNFRVMDFNDLPYNFTVADESGKNSLDSFFLLKNIKTMSGGRKSKRKHKKTTKKTKKLLKIKKVY
jgi:hypothetical protein